MSCLDRQTTGPYWGSGLQPASCLIFLLLLFHRLSPFRLKPTSVRTNWVFGKPCSEPRRKENDICQQEAVPRCCIRSSDSVETTSMVLTRLTYSKSIRKAVKGQIKGLKFVKIDVAGDAK
ncbi:uncharacterized protein YALI1_B01892g [Yarrowia lipolytica]|uniref:Uncharacterized protein n=1 Tax=Yarrowia lipolytica TaxID=4952 RepID=A0A1D8N602_YARLL|nr:hypothetical protein YALI1_B01892g [Yarrowia lipolytica]